ncbi:mitochondrial distribution and morphology [Coemansia javaensis]|uniref:Mitochondrial distribution and morphology n=1 Tax=Coemansia javaensis TaxID=2761396 RepID=A0A9W8LG24_9FUNG|nr:mitochondrial distribution and morphology [Coemansia javaensis]
MEALQLRPIYDALDRTDMRRALAECERVLRKHASHYGARALKTFVLAKTGQTSEALALGQSLLDTPAALASQHVQQGLSMAYRVLGRPDDEIAVYTGALAAAPESVVLRSKIYLAAARSLRFKEQHLAAVELAKRCRGQRTLWWLVVALLLCATSAPRDAPTTAVQLALAERTAAKALAEGQLTTLEELRVYLDVLEAQGKRAEMLAAMGADAGLAAMVLRDPDLVTKRIALMRQTGAHEDAARAAVAALDARDNWADYVHYIGAVAALCLDSDAACEPSSAAWANLQRWAAEPGRARSAKLAAVALAAELHADGRRQAAGAVPAPEVCIWDYVDGFRHKAICYTDIMQYIVGHVRSAPDGEARVAVAARLDEQLGPRLLAAREAAGRGADAAQAWISLERIRYLLQALRGETGAAAWAADVVPLLAFGLESKEARKKQPACSDAVLIAAQRLIQAAFFAHGAAGRSGQLAAALFCVVCVLEAGIRLNDNTPLLKLYAVRLYLYLSCYDRARAIYDTLRVKHIQHDTLAHIIAGQGVALGCHMPDLELCYDGVAFYDMARAKIPRELEAAYQNGTYSNVRDFIEFQDNLAHAMQRECTHRLALRAEALAHASAKDILANWADADARSIAHTDESLAALHDNRDLAVMGLLTPPDMLPWNLELLTRPAPLPGAPWIRAFSLVPQIMHYIVAADVDAADARAAELAALLAEAGDALSPQDALFARGICAVAAVYSRASSKSESIDAHLDALVELVRGRLPDEQLGEPDSADALGDLALRAIRDAAAATELFAYAVILKHALAAQRLPAAAPAGLALGELRKAGLRAANALRGWADKRLRAHIDAHWIASGDDALLYLVCSKHKQSVDLATKACVTSWQRSAKGLLAQWEQLSL